MSSHVSRSDAKSDLYDLADSPSTEPPTNGSRTGVGAGPGSGSRSAEAAEMESTSETDSASKANPASTSEPESAAKASDAKAEATATPTPVPPKKRKRRKRGGLDWRWDAPSWGVSLMVHASILAALTLMAVGGGMEEMLGSIDASTVDTSLSEELTPILDDPSEMERELAVGDPTSVLSPGAAPSATPAIRADTVKVSETQSLAGLIDVAVPTPSNLLLPSMSALNRDLSGGNRISGDVGRPADDYGEALDQLAREILAHLAKSRVTVLWMFDESGSMKDDQRTLRDRFDRVVGELKVRVPADRREAGDLEHAIVGYGKTIHFEDSRPRADLEEDPKRHRLAAGRRVGRRTDDAGHCRGARPVQPGHQQGPEGPSCPCHR